MALRILVPLILIMVVVPVVYLYATLDSRLAHFASQVTRAPQWPPVFQDVVLVVFTCPMKEIRTDKFKDNDYIWRAMIGLSSPERFGEKAMFELHVDDHRNDLLPNNQLSLSPVSPHERIWAMITIPVPSSTMTMERATEITREFVKEMSTNYENYSFIHIYEGTRHVYTEYGGYTGRNFQQWKNEPRTWQTDINAKYSGIRKPARSPYVITLTGFAKPSRLKHLSVKDWATQVWFPIQAPMSEVMQPRARYVRNLITKRVNATSPAFDALVIEAWPSNQHVYDLFLYFGIKDRTSIWGLITNIFTMLASVNRFTDLWSLQQFTMGEYLL